MNENSEVTGLGDTKRPPILKKNKSSREVNGQIASAQAQGSKKEKQGASGQRRPQKGKNESNIIQINIKDTENQPAPQHHLDSLPSGILPYSAT